ncbi:MAG: 6,7-dimethyl-8-ribityllumazine synthase [PVC group bacterium]
MKIYEGKLNAAGLKFGLVISRFNEFITGKLLEGALDALKRNGAAEDDIEAAWVPGSWEIPAAAARMARSRRYDAIICLGAVIKGATAHWQYISTQVTRGIAAVGQESSLPVSYGLITPDTLEQAIERAGTKAGNKGFDAAMAAIEMANLFKELA